MQKNLLGTISVYFDAKYHTACIHLILGKMAIKLSNASGIYRLQKRLHVEGKSCIIFSLILVYQ
jgi:hypothetical protein